MENIFYWSRLRWGEKHPDMVVFDVVCVSASEMDGARTLLAGTGRELRLRAPETLSAFGDVGMFRLLLRNLLSNAIRYSPVSEPVELVITASDGVVELCVLDGGKGLPDGVRTALADREDTFLRGDKSGYGLGLSVSKELASKLGSALRIEPRPDGGTCAGFELSGLACAWPRDSVIVGEGAS